IRSPKTERHADNGIRTIPIFPELREHLDAVWDQAPDSEFVISHRDSAINLRTQLERIIAKAGLKPWPKLFQNLRSTRETELAAVYPLHVVTAWIGHTAAIAAKHYLQVTDADFERASAAAQEASQSVAPRSGQKRTRKSTAPRKSAPVSFGPVLYASIVGG